MEEIRFILGLSLIKGFGPKTCRDIIDAIEYPEIAFTESFSALAKRRGFTKMLIDKLNREREKALALADKELLWLESVGCKAVSYLQPDYPQALENSYAPPVIIYKRGNCDLNRKKILSVVGTRRITPHGRDICQSIISELASRHPDLLIVSGLAYGTDIVAHRAALESGIDTAAVVAHGLDVIYPAEHCETARQIAEQGCIITEYPINTNPDKPNFVQRNRIVAALAQATLVIESDIKGGSMITARNAFEADRMVLAVPGRPSDTYSRGCNKLIASNMASLVQSASDIEKLLEWDKKAEQPTLFCSECSPVQQQIIDALSQVDEMPIDELSRRLAISVDKLRAELTQLEMDDLVSSVSGSAVRLCNAARN